MNATKIVIHVSSFRLNDNFELTARAEPKQFLGKIPDDVGLSVCSINESVKPVVSIILN